MTTQFLVRTRPDSWSILIRLHTTYTDQPALQAITIVELCCPSAAITRNGIDKISEAPNQIDVKLIPFLGLFFRRKLIRKTGLRDAGILITAL